MARIHLVEHAPGAPGLRLMGLGPNLRPSRGLLKLRRLLNKHAFWAQGRSRQQLSEMLKDSQVVVSLWRGKRMVGFGRANSNNRTIDTVYCRSQVVYCRYGGRRLA